MSRLLTDTQVWGICPSGCYTSYCPIYQGIAKAQDAKTAQLKDEEWQAKIRQIFEEIEKKHKGGSRVVIWAEDFQALKEKWEVKDG